MANWKKLLKNVLLTDGKIDKDEVRHLKKEFLADDVIDDEEIDFLVDLRNSAKKQTKEFDGFFFDAMERNILQDGRIDAGEVVKLRKIIMADGKVDASECKFLTTLKSAAGAVDPSFNSLYDECMRMAPKKAAKKAGKKAGKKKGKKKR